MQLLLDATTAAALFTTSRTQSLANPFPPLDKDSELHKKRSIPFSDINIVCAEVEPPLPELRDKLRNLDMQDMSVNLCTSEIFKVLDLVNQQAYDKIHLFQAACHANAIRYHKYRQDRAE